ncbi:MAG: FAD-dependent oxidoreductase, partial [Planctomycetales bacterium]|nr:FAD-dependent oxidoreductase [Planctomycetales bacterium]
QQGESQIATMQQWLVERRYGAWFIDRYLAPMTAAIWSAPPAQLGRFPARFLLGFMRNHGLLQLRDRPQWRTIVGGSRRYVQSLADPLLRRQPVGAAAPRIELGRPVSAIRRRSDGVRLLSGGVAYDYDAVVLATHADVSLRLLADADGRERDVLASFPYQSNSAALHTDRSFLPRRRRAWASWNCRLRMDAAGGLASSVERNDSGHEQPGEANPPAGVCVTYDLGRLQGVETDRPLLLTLNAEDAIDPQQTLREFRFDHPAYGIRSRTAQEQYDWINGRGGVYYCGAYWGYGFHEDGVASGIRAAAALGADWETCIAASTKATSSTIVDGTSSTPCVDRNG